MIALVVEAVICRPSDKLQPCDTQEQDAVGEANRNPGQELVVKLVIRSQGTWEGPRARSMRAIGTLRMAESAGQHA